MLSTAMLARIRTLLDEATEGFWLDTEIYSSLSDGQNEIIKTVVAEWVTIRDQGNVLPTPLRPLLKTIMGTGISITVPEDYIEYADFHYNNRAYRIVSPNDTFIFHNNDYLTEWVEFSAGLVTVNTKFTGLDYILNYIAKPDDIDATHEATLDIRFHNDIVDFAFKRMLIKNQSGENVTAGT